MQEYDLLIVSVPQDAAKAEELAKSIREYKLPKSAGNCLAEGPHRSVFVDSSGSAFDEAAAELLDRSRYMALMCSPATKSDKGILDRLEYFRKNKAEENIVAVIVEGEPIDSFPETFIQKKTVQHILPDMTIVEREETIEPVAADLRGNTKARRKEVLKYETVRITASILGLHPDVLEQRHKRRRRRAFIALAAVVGAVCLAASAIFLRLGYIAKVEGDIAEQQTLLSLRIAERTVNELPEQFADDPQALEYIDETIANAEAVIAEQGLEGMLSGAAGGNGG